MKSASTKRLRTAALLSAVLGSLVIFLATMSAHDKYREKLIQRPVQPAAGSVQVSAAYPQKTGDAELLLEIKIESEKKQGRAVVVWNGREIGRIRASGHHFMKISRELFLTAGNSLLLKGLPADCRITMLEIKNLYGFSTGLLESVMVLPGTPAITRVPWLLATFLAVLILLLSFWMPKAAALTADNAWLRFGAWVLLVFFLAILALPLFVPVRVYLGIKTTLLLIALLYMPGIVFVLRSLTEFFRARIVPWIRNKKPRLEFTPRQWQVAGAVALAALFVFFAVHRQRYVGASDWYGYYAESLMFRQGRLTMKTTYPPKDYIAFAPLGFNAVGNRVIPQYPPGFPLLLALFGLLGLEFYVNALAGVLTVFLLYLILKNTLGRGMAFLFASLWAVFPVTMYISIRLMSDLVATAFILLTYYLFTRNKIFWSGVAFSFAVAVRPSCVLFFVVFLPLLLKKKKFWPFCFSGAIIGSLYGVYNWAVFGKPWTTGYGLFATELTGRVFWHHFIYYGKTIFMVMTPLLIVPALWALRRLKPRRWFFLGWAVAFWIFYSFWLAGADSWWYLRFLLPGLPALFILAAIGTQEIRQRLQSWKPRWQPLWNSLGVVLLLVLVSYFFSYSVKNWVFSADKGEMYYKASKKIQSLVPPGALVGGIEMSGPLRLYAGIESFRWDFLPQSVTLIRDFLAKGRPLYLSIEPWNDRHPAFKEICDNFNVETVAWMPGSVKILLLAGPAPGLNGKTLFCIFGRLCYNRFLFSNRN